MGSSKETSQCVCKASLTLSKKQMYYSIDVLGKPSLKKKKSISGHSESFWLNKNLGENGGGPNT